ncbi:unnamed protein product [Camellia sinensis]
MAAKFQKWVALCLFSLFISSIPLSSSQCNSPQNIQTFYPFPPPPTPPSPSEPPTLPPTPPLPPPPSPPPQHRKSFSKEVVTKAVAITTASTLVLAWLFFLLMRYSRRRRENGKNTSSNPYRDDRVVPRDEFVRFDGNISRVIVDENGLDAIYWKRLEEGNIINNFDTEVLNDSSEDEKWMISRCDRSEKSEPTIKEISLLRGKSSTSRSDGIVLNAMEKEDSPIQPPPPPPPLPTPVLTTPKTQSLAPPQPPRPLPTPLLAIPKTQSPAPPPPSHRALSLASSSTSPPPPPKVLPSDNKRGESSSKEGMIGDGSDQVKLRPLHRDKVNPNVDHSMVLHKVDGGSFRFDGDLMEALFGTVATNRKSPRININSLSPRSERSNPTSQIVVLDARKSQNIAIVLRSLAISRKDIIDALSEAEGLNADTLEKLTTIAPTDEEESKILAFDGEPSRLADAESFLYHLLRTVPSAFACFNAMLFRSNYDSETLYIKETLQTLESGCKELRTRGLFLKLLETILKAGNRMNAGTSRGHAQAFNLTSLRKLSDVKSADGKTTLLHFVVEEVVRAEGKRCITNRNRSLSHTSSRSSNHSGQNSDSLILEDDREREYLMFGLPVLGGLSDEFGNVKKAATIDHDTFAKTCPALTARVAEIRKLLTRCGNAEGGGFVREMKSFLDAAEEEIIAVSEEQTRVMELVKRTTEYYQPGASKDKKKHPFQLFVIVKDFLGMVDQVCIGIAKNLQKRKNSITNVGSSSPKSPTRKISVRFPILPANFLSDESNSNSSESDDDDF